MREIVLAAVFCSCLSAVWSSEPVPYGHPDFYPSPERPLAWRGDGTGTWPGARPVTNWNADTGLNVVWRSPMPAPSFAQPIVVGERVFTMADPDWLVCVNVHDGTILWQTEIDNEKRNVPGGQWYAGTGTGTRFCASPFLLDGKLIVNQNGEIRAYEAATGKKIWGTYNPHNVTGQFPYMWRRSGPAVPDPRGAQRLKAVSRDKVEIENVWSLERSGAGGGGSDAYHVGRLFLIHQVFDSRTGEVRLLDPSLATGKQDVKVDASCPSPIVAGGYEYCFGRGGDAWVFDVRGGPVITIRPAYKDNRVNEEKEWLWRHAWCGNQQNSSPCAQANRIFWRSKGYLWCFGDPKLPFPAPRDCPREGRANTGTVQDGRQRAADLQSVRLHQNKKE